MTKFQYVFSSIYKLNTLTRIVLTSNILYQNFPCRGMFKQTKLLYLQPVKIDLNIGEMVPLKRDRRCGKYG